MEPNERKENLRRKSADNRIIIRSPVSLAIFAIAILTMAAMALTLISEATPILI
jgi:hypothetical protein